MNDRGRDRRVHVDDRRIRAARGAAECVGAPCRLVTCCLACPEWDSNPHGVASAGLGPLPVQLMLHVRLVFPDLDLPSISAVKSEGRVETTQVMSRRVRPTVASAGAHQRHMEARAIVAWTRDYGAVGQREFAGYERSFRCRAPSLSARPRAARSGSLGHYEAGYSDSVFGCAPPAPDQSILDWWQRGNFASQNRRWDDRRRELWLPHAAGWILFEDVRGYALGKLNEGLSERERTIARSAIDDATCGLMMVIHDVSAVCTPYGWRPTAPSAPASSPRRATPSPTTGGTWRRRTSTGPSATRCRWARPRTRHGWRR